MHVYLHLFFFIVIIIIIIIFIIMIVIIIYHHPHLDDEKGHGFNELIQMSEQMGCDEHLHMRKVISKSRALLLIVCMYVFICVYECNYARIPPR